MAACGVGFFLAGAFFEAVFLDAFFLVVFFFKTLDDLAATFLRVAALFVVFLVVFLAATGSAP